MFSPPPRVSEAPAQIWSPARGGARANLVVAVSAAVSSAVTPVMVDAVLAELPPLISESDMHVSQMALSFLSTLAVTHPSLLGQLSGGSILTQLIALVRSPLLQGGALAAMLDFYQVRRQIVEKWKLCFAGFWNSISALDGSEPGLPVPFQALVSTDTAGLGYMDLLRMLTGPVYSQSAALPHKQAYCSIAKCVAALTRACPAEGPAVVGQFIQVGHGAEAPGRSPRLTPFCSPGREEQPLHGLHSAAGAALPGRGRPSRGPERPTGAQDRHPGRLLVLQRGGDAKRDSLAPSAPDIFAR